jgi:hypothetical protein
LQGLELERVPLMNARLTVSASDGVPQVTGLPDDISLINEPRPTAGH